MIRPDFDDETLARVNPEGLAKHFSWTWTSDDHGLLACAGILPIISGVRGVWAIVNPALAGLRCRGHLVRALYDLHREGCAVHNIRRLEAQVDDRHPAGHTLVKHLGYRYEGSMEEYGLQGEIKHRYAWLMKDHTDGG